MTFLPPQTPDRIPRADLHRAEAVAHRLPEVLARRKLKPAFSSWMLTRYAGMSLLLGVLDTAQISRLEAYATPELLHHLSTDIGGLPVYLSNSTGLRYVVVIGSRPSLPRRVDFPGMTPGRALLGVRCTGQPVGPTWQDLGHVLIAGMTGSGKSGLIRTLAYQAVNEGMQLLLSDLDGRTLPMLAGHPSLLAPIASDPQAARELVERALGECEHRAALFSQAAGYPDDLEEYNRQPGAVHMPRVLVILDEFSATIQDLGGPGSPFARQVSQLGFRGRKFGVNLVFAAQDFSKAVVGAVRDQVGSVVAFRVRSADTARNVSCPQAAKIHEGRPGLAFTDRWGPIQAYYLDKQLLSPQASIPFLPVLSAAESELVSRAEQDAGGRMSIPLLVGWGMPERAARGLVEDWERRGWLERVPSQANARYITAKLRGLASNRQTGQTASNRA